MKKFLLIAALSTFMSGVQAFGQTAAFNFQTVGTFGSPGAGFQAYNNADLNLASLFTVNEGITVSELGIFDSSGTGLINGPISVGLFDISTGTTVGTTVTFNGQYAPDGFAVYQAITPVYLAPGSYEVDTVGYGNTTEPNGNSNLGPALATPNTLGGALSFPVYTANENVTGVAYYSFTSTLTYPNGGVDHSGVADYNLYEAGDFKAVVPEGGAAALYLALAGLVCFGSVFASRRQLGSRA